MQIDPSMSGKDVSYENGCLFDDNDNFDRCFNKKIFISHDNAFGMKFEPQEASMNDLYITPLEDCLKSVGSKVIVIQERQANVSLVSSQVVHIQDKIY